MFFPSTHTQIPQFRVEIILIAFVRRQSTVLIQLEIQPIQLRANVEEQYVVPVQFVLHRVVFVRLQPVATLMVVLLMPQTVNAVLQLVPVVMDCFVLHLVMIALLLVRKRMYLNYFSSFVLL